MIGVILLCTLVLGLSCCTGEEEGYVTCQQRWNEVVAGIL